MDVSFDCELNVFSNFEPNSFVEEDACDEWKEAMKSEYDVVIKNGTWKLVDPPIRTKPIGCNWVYKNKYKSYGSLDKHKARPVSKGYAQGKELTLKKHYPPRTNGLPSAFALHGSTKEVESPPNGCKKCFFLMET